VFVDGREITSLPERFLTEIRRRTFGFIFQQFHLIRGISALENVMLPAYTTGEKHAALRERALRLLDLFGLAAKARARVEWLSGGEAQRVAIGRALVNNPTVVIADEPTAHLDTKLSRDFLGIMERLNAEGKTILIASHDPLVYESALADRVVEMRDGRILSSGRAV
jgi:putative ABC transport system ATP-binding protein